MKLTELKSRREKFIASLDGAAVVIPAADYKQRSNDTEFPFRQNSNFYYLTGLHEPEAYFVITPKGKSAITTLFVRPKDALMELWSGIRLGTDKAKELTGVDQCFDIGDFEKILPELLSGHDTVGYDFYESESLWPKILTSLKVLRKKRNCTEARPISTLDISDLIGRLRLVKSEAELDLMRRAAAISNKAHRAAMAQAAPGKTEKDLNATMEYIFIGHGGDSNAYDSIVATGQNGLVLHYVENDKPIRDGDTLLIDAGCQYGLYASDVTRTFPANGKFSEPQKELYQVCLDAQLSCIEFIKAGKTIKELHDHAIEVLVDGMLKLGILKGDKDQLIKDEKYKEFYPHGTGHWLGLDVHDQSPYLNEKWELTKLEKGMCFTIEPGLYIPVDAKDVPKQYLGLSVRIEDDIVISDNGVENLTALIPKTIEEVEAACAADYKEFLP